MPQYISGRELADIKEVVHRVRVQSLRKKGIVPRLAIVQTIASPVIDMYVRVKKTYAEKIGILVDHYVLQPYDTEKLIEELNKDNLVHGIIIQLPLHDELKQEKTLNQVLITKDVDGLAFGSSFVPPTVQSIMWLLDAYVPQIELKKIALVGKGRLVGAPLEKELLKVDISPRVFVKNDNLASLFEYDVVISATGVPGLITNNYINNQAYVLDAGTAEENGSIHGDVADELYLRDGIHITPTKGGVGILTVRALFENILRAAEESYKKTQ